VVAIARGAHGAAIQRDGLRLDSPTGSEIVAVPVVASVSDVEIDRDDVVLLAMKSQDTIAALESLRAVAPSTTAVVCMQNGVDNERAALRRFTNVYGLCVMCPTGYLEAGVVEAHSSPITGIMDIGRYPHGTDDTATRVADALSNSSFVSIARPDIMRWKYRKLIMNLGNALEAVCGPAARSGRLADIVQHEGEAVLQAAGIDVASAAQDAARRGDLLKLGAVNGHRRGGGSSWQSLQRGAGSIETDYLNGEIALLGREHSIPTPANALLQTLATQIAAAHGVPGSISADEVLARLGST
jgi:2-dehydropantoate 2-reductase